MKHFTVYTMTVLFPFTYSTIYYNIRPVDCLGVLAGLFVWWLAEYGFHRFAFHNENLSSRTYKLLAYNHLGHHFDPENSTNLFLPFRLTLPVAFLLFLVVWGIFGVVVASLFLAGLFVGLAWYEFVHHQAHNRMYNIFPLNYLTRRHLNHHYVDETKTFGVSSPFVDWVMHTK